MTSPDVVNVVECVNVFDVCFDFDDCLRRLPDRTFSSSLDEDDAVEDDRGDDDPLEDLFLYPCLPVLCRQRLHPRCDDDDLSDMSLLSLS